jgi:hypothetical protein
MPFDEEYDNDQPSVQSQKVGLKNVSSQKSIFDNMPKKPTQEDLDRKVKKVEERASGYKAKAAELVVQFNKSMADKTLPQNKNMFQKEVEMELLREMIKLAQEINSSVHEREGEGSLSWITILLKNSFVQRDRINVLEYQLSQLSAKTDPANLSDFISKEIAKALDKIKTNE